MTDKYAYFVFRAISGIAGAATVSQLLQDQSDSP